MKVKSESEVAQSYPTLCDPMDCSLPGSSINGIFQARVLEWGAIDSIKKVIHVSWGYEPHGSSCIMGAGLSVTVLAGSTGNPERGPLQLSPVCVC